MLFMAHGENSTMKPQDKSNTCLYLPSTEKMLVEIYCCLLTCSCINAFVTMKPANCGLSSPGSLPPYYTEPEKREGSSAITCHSAWRTEW